MTEITLRSLDATNFRSIRGHIHAPLDSRVVLVHGENGAGKTSLLSAIELALTGGVQSLQRADPAYAKQLLYRSAADGNVTVKATRHNAEETFGASLNADGALPFASLPPSLSTFFRERSFLPQSLLGQLLQIYQDSGNDIDSPLARFVGNLLGLDRLDALEAGLKPFADIRNVRKTVEGWLAAENDKTRFERLIAEQSATRGISHGQVTTALGELAKSCTSLGLSVEVREDTLDQVTLELAETSDADAFAHLADQQRRLGSILREIQAAEVQTQAGVTVQLPSSDDASKAYARWESEHGTRIAALRPQIEALLPDASLLSDPERFHDDAGARLRTSQKQLTDRIAQARADLLRHSAAQAERDIQFQQRKTVDAEIERLSTDAGSLASALAELTSFISSDICPVCDRNFGDVSDSPLADHVHGKIRQLSASAERLLTLGRARSDIQVTVERLEREIESIAARIISEKELADIDRRLSTIDAAITQLDALGEILREGARLRAADVATRRLVTEVQSRHVALAAAGETLSAFAISIGADALVDGESFASAAQRLAQMLATAAANLESRLSLRRRGTDQVAAIRAAVMRRTEVDNRMLQDAKVLNRAENALERAQTLRDDCNAIRSAVDNVRSSIIRREFNDRLNRLWRDLFIRLAPSEPFIPAFRIPAASTQRLQPKLVTEHRDGGDAGGTPGAMLSAGNLNTAALTLFIALHMSVPKELPWLILDDPVQSMDDVHIAHFAALLRTLSKEHGRQVIIAVHDRQLFEYLKLELSPAFPDDSLLTLELSRGPRRDSVCVAHRLSFKEETALLAVA